MKKRIIAVADTDDEYLDYLTKFVQHTEYSRKYSIKTFTALAPLIQFLNNHQVDILLVHQDMMPHDDTLKDSTTLIQLLEISSPSDTVDLFSVYKYQPFTSLFQSISDLLRYRILDHAVEIKQLQTRVISVFSPVGGVGKTAIALNLARLLAENDYRVFYLNLEWLSSANALFPKEEEDQFSRLIYDMYAQEEQRYFQVERLIRFDTRYKFFHFPPLHHPAEILDLTEHVAEKLLVALDQLSHFDYIIVDLETSQLDSTLYMLKRSEQVLWVCQDDWHFQHKNRLWLELTKKKDHLFYQALLSKTYYILNKFLGADRYDQSTTQLSYDFYLPYIPEWKHTKSIQSLFHPTVFKRELYKLYALLNQQSNECKNRLESS